MTISKLIRRNHAYTSRTFALARDYERGQQSAILQGGGVSEAAPYASPGSISVAPFIVQLGGLLIVSDDVETVAYNQPTAPGAQLYLLLSSPDDSESSGLVWTVTPNRADTEIDGVFVFAIRENLGGATAGAAWVQPANGSLRSILRRQELPLAPDAERASRLDGGSFRLDVDAARTDSPIVVLPPSVGGLATSWGGTAEFGDGGLVLPPAHHAGWRRDRLVLRRGNPGFRGRMADAQAGGGSDPESALDRHARIEVLTGVPRTRRQTTMWTGLSLTTLATTFGVTYTTGGRMAAAINEHVTARDGTFAQAPGYNEVYLALQLSATDRIRASRVATDRATLSAAVDSTAVEASRVDFNVVVLPTGESIILYTTTAGAGAWTKLYASKVNADGSAFVFEDTLVYDASVGTASGGQLVASAGIHRPKAFVDEEGKVQVVMEVEMDPAAAGGPAFDTAEALYWIKLDDSAAVVSEPVRLTDPSSGTSPEAPVRYADVQFREGLALISAIRDTDVTTDGGEAIFLAFADPSQVWPVVASDSTTVAQANRSSRQLELGSYVSNKVAAAGVLFSRDGRGHGVVFSAEDSGGTWRRYVHYGAGNLPTLSNGELRNDGNAVFALMVDAHSNERGALGTTPATSQIGTGLVAVHDGAAIHTAGWDAVAGKFVYERIVGHSINDKPYLGDMTASYELADAAEPADAVMLRAPSGEPILVRVITSGGTAGQVALTEILDPPGVLNPELPRVTVIAEFDVPPASAAYPAPVMRELAQVTAPHRELVVGARAGAYVGVAGLLEAVTALRETGGTIRVRSGSYELFQPIPLTSNIEIKCDPGAIFVASSEESPAAISAAGATINVSAVDAEGVATFTGLSAHLRLLGFSEGALLKQTFGAGDEFYISEIFEEDGRFSVVDFTMPPGNYRLHHTGIQWTGGTFVGLFLTPIHLRRVAHSRFSGMSFKLGVPAAYVGGTEQRLIMLSGCADITIEDVAADLNDNGVYFANSSAYAPYEESYRVTVRGCRFRGGFTVGHIDDWIDFQLVDCRLDVVSAGSLQVRTLSSGHIDRIRGDGNLTLSLSGTGKVVVGDTDFGTQTDSSRSGLYGDTDNKPSWTDGHFRGNVYIQGFLNHGQYELAIMSLAMLVLDEQLFQLFGMVDGFTEGFETFTDVDGASTYGRWYPSAAQLSIGAPAGDLQAAQLGLSDQVAPDYHLESYAGVRPMESYDDIGYGLGGRHLALRGVIHHEATGGGNFTQAGFPDRGKIEFQGSFDTGVEGRDLVGEVSASDYNLLRDNVGGAGVDGVDVELSAVRYDVVTPINVGVQYSDLSRWQRVFAAYTSVDSNRTVVISSRVTSGAAIWSLNLYVDVFNAATGEHLGGCLLADTIGATPEMTIHQVDSTIPLEMYGEVADVKIVPDLTDSTKLCVFVLGRFREAIAAYSWENAVRYAHIDLSAVTIDPANLFVDITGAAAGTKWINLESGAGVMDRWRGLAVVPAPDNFGGSLVSTNNYAVAFYKGTWAVGDATVHNLYYSFFEQSTERFIGGSVASGAGFTGFAPVAMANDTEQGAMTSLGVLAQTLATGSSWPWKPLHGGFYDDGGDPCLVFVMAYAPDSTSWAASDLAAVRVRWAAASLWNAPDTVTTQVAPATIDLAHGPYVAWDQPATRFLVGYAEANGFGGGHTQDEVFTTEVTWGGSWTWGSTTSHRAMATPTIGTLVGTQKGDPTDASVDQRLNLAWQGEPAGDQTLWAAVQIDTSNAVTLAPWYDPENPDLVSATTYQHINEALYWMSDLERDASAEIAGLAGSAGLDREHMLLYHKSTGTYQGAAYLRCVGPKLAVKLEIDVPWGANLDGDGDINIRGAGATTDNSGQVDGYIAYRQVAYRSSNDLTHANAAPDQDEYDGATPHSQAHAYPASGAWSGASLATLSSATLLSAPSKRDVFSVNPAHTSLLWAAGDTVLPLEGTTTFGPQLLTDVEDLYSLMVGQIVEINNGSDPAVEHRITYLGQTAGGMFAAIVEPPIVYAADATPANNTLTFKKEVVGLVVVPQPGESTIAQPERIWFNRLDVELEQQPVVIGAAVDTTPLVPPASAVVLLGLIDIDGDLAADIAAGGADLDDYLLLELSRDNGTSYTQVTFEALGGASPLFQQVLPDGSVHLIVYGTITWPIAPSTDKDVVYRLTWVGSSFLGKRLNVDQIMIGWN